MSQKCHKNAGHQSKWIRQKSENSTIGAFLIGWKLTNNQNDGITIKQLADIKRGRIKMARWKEKNVMRPGTKNARWKLKYENMKMLETFFCPAVRMSQYDSDSDNKLANKYMFIATVLWNKKNYGWQQKKAGTHTHTFAQKYLVNIHACRQMEAEK